MCLYDSVPQEITYENEQFKLDFISGADAIYYGGTFNTKRVVLRVNIISNKFELIKSGDAAMYYVLNIMRKFKNKENNSHVLILNDSTELLYDYINSFFKRK